MSRKGASYLKDIHSNITDKQAESQKRSKVYSTEKINNMIYEMNHGGSPDMDPFWHGQQQYRDAGIIFEYTDWELNELEKCANDPIYFIETYCTFKNDKGRTTVKLRDYQKETIHLYGDEVWDPVSETAIPKNRRIILMWSRQCAKTTTTAAYFTHFLIFNNDRSALVVANKGRTGTEIMDKIKEVLQDLPFFMKPGIINLATNKMKFENGCSLQTAAASKTPATGDSINLLYIDECALIPNNIIKEYWASVYPTLSSFRGSQIIISSTPRGKGNLFYEFYNGAVMGTKKGWKYKRVDWWQVPEHDEEWLNQQKQDLGDDLFKREVELSFESAGERLITNHTIKYFNKIKKVFKPVEFFSVPNEISKNILWDPDFHPDQLTYLDLLNKRFLLSIDTAQGIEAGAVGKEDADYNVINIFEIQLLCPGTIERNRDNKPINIKDVVRYKQIGIYIDNFKDESTCAEAAKYIIFHILKSGYKKIDNTRVLIEMNFNGNNWLTKFKDHPSYYDGVIIKTQHGIPQPGQKPKYQYGYKTTSGNHGKNYYCELGSSMMHKGQICIRQYNDDNINKSSLGQLQQFGKNEKGNYSGSCCHDDIAITCLFICIAQESTQYRSWLNEWLETCKQTLRVLIIRRMLNIYIEKEVQMSDEDFKRFYNVAGQNFSRITHQQNGYGSLMSGNNYNRQQNQYYNVFNKYNHYR